MNYKAVLFDMDGVIINSEPIHFMAFKAVLKKHGYTLSSTDYKKYFAGKTDEAGFKQYFNAIGDAPDISAIMAEKATIYLDLAADRFIAYPGVVPFIKKLSARGVHLALVTGSLRAEAELAVKTLEIKHLFSAIVAAEDIIHSKPNPEGYLKAAAALNISPAESIVIEDSPSGIKAARSAGMDCLGVTTTHLQKELLAAGATEIVTELQASSLN